MLPLFVLVSAVPDSVYKFSPEIVSKVQAIMASSNVSKPLPLMKEAVKNLYSSLENEASYIFVHSQIIFRPNQSERIQQLDHTIRLQR